MRKIIFYLFFLIFFINPNPVFAEKIHSFNTNIVAHQNGTMDITEIIDYDFENEYRHGIYRDIPLYSAVGDLYRIIQIKDVSVLRDSQRENFKLTNDGKKLDIKIGNADKTINGNHTYLISYKIVNGIGSNFADHDEIYWNITGNNWKVNIEKVSGKIETDFDAKLNKLICFEGTTGSKNQTCNVFHNSFNSSRIIYPGLGLTIVATYPINTFPKSTLSKALPQSMTNNVFEFIFANYRYVFIALNFVLAPYLIYWYFKHKNNKNYSSSAVNFDIPKDGKNQIIRPALAGTIDNAKLEVNDVAATIFDLAIRRYIKIEETKTILKFLPDIKEQKIIKLKDADDKLNPYEKRLFDRLFKDKNNINISDLRKDFYLTYLKIEDDIFEELVKNGFYAKNPKMQKNILRVAAFLSILLLSPILAIVLIFLSIKLNGRTVRGDEMDSKIHGLKIFLKSMSRNYKWQTQKLYTVEEMIPYAMALGLINEFMKQLKIIQPDYSPSWYSGYRGSFYAGYISLYSGITTSMAPPSSSGSHGGFSGGGGGGGGGGSW